MSISKELDARSGSKCELCRYEENLMMYNVPSGTSDRPNEDIVTCATCYEQINRPETMDVNHWRCLNDSMWSETLAVQVMAWRLLNRLKSEGWPQDLLDMMYMDEDTAKWAAATGEGSNAEATEKHIDSNGNELESGDNVTITQTLNVKGANINAAKGTVVNNIRLVPDEPTQIEGRVENQMIVILTKFIKKTK